MIIERGSLSCDIALAGREEFGREVIENAERDLMAASGTRRYLARRDGIAVGGASFRVAGGIAQFTGAATRPARRRRGIQSALLSARLADAAAAAATSRSSPRRRRPRPSRTRSARASTCSTPARSWSGNSRREVAAHADARPTVQAERDLVLADRPQAGG